MDVANFFTTPNSEGAREFVIAPNEILTGIQIPLKGLKNATYEVRHRTGLDWPMVTASVAFAFNNGTATVGTHATIEDGQTYPIYGTAETIALIEVRAGSTLAVSIVQHVVI